MRFSDEFLAELRSRVDIVELVGRYAEIRQPGARNPKCLCPFHTEKTPSFVLYPHNQSFYCFGCGIGGDAVTFVRNIERLDYTEAVRYLCERVGMRMPDEGVDDAYTAVRRRCYEANREAARFFHAALRSEAGAAARAYLSKRALSDETVTRFGLGYAPESWDALLKHLRARGFGDDELTVFNLCRRSSKGSVFDTFRNRLMFPILDLRGNVVAFGGRVLDDSKPKYVNTADTPVYKKGQGIFGLNLAKNNKERTLILCEGYMDVIAMHQAGYTNAVAALGTAFTSEQVSLLSRYCDELVLSYDSDEAGQKATARALKMLANAPLRVRVMTLEGGKDPDEILRSEGRGKMDLLLDRAANDTEYALAGARRGADLGTDDGRLRYLNAAAEILAGIANPVERDLYLSRVAEQTGTAKEPLAQRVAGLRKKKDRRGMYESFERDARAAAGASNAADGGVVHNPEKRAHRLAAAAEETILASLIRSPDYLRRLRGRLNAELFVTARNRAMFEGIAKRIEEGRDVDFSMYSEENGNEDVSYLAWLTARGEQIAGTLKECEECIDTLLGCQARAAAPAVGTLTDEEFLRRLSEKGRNNPVN